jgi:hypothetical protein
MRAGAEITFALQHGWDVVESYPARVTFIGRLIQVILSSVYFEAPYILGGDIKPTSQQFPSPF